MPDKRARKAVRADACARATREVEAVGVGRDRRHRSTLYAARSGMIQRTPPRGSATSPSYRGIRWRCRCETVCPAAGPSSMPGSNASGACRSTTIRRASSARSNIPSRSAAVASNHDATCRRGTISACPGFKRVAVADGERQRSFREIPPGGEVAERALLLGGSSSAPPFLGEIPVRIPTPRAPPIPVC